MYVATFYSFKGGVGRTMALVNVAVELARKGRRVLAVDFDLEAPGLDTFDLSRPSGKSPGVIDFVSAYANTGRAPDVGSFLFESTDVGFGHGSLWIMPAGAHRDSYATTFAEIDWADLYENHDGYLLFEDLKEQWRELLKPDYVLIDSRTGHTDTGGICTRQLPDAVVVLFFPNAQNLRGLTKVVHDIRVERAEPAAKTIDLHFVMSNVPDLDDEDKILEESIASFQRNLGFHGEPLMIHRYDSLSLLNQVIFSKDRRRSRLAREYGGLAAEIMRLNPMDRDGALMYIDGLSRNNRTTGSSTGDRANIDEHLQKIETNHQNDGEVLFRTGSLRAEDGRFDDAIALFGSAIDAGYRAPDVFLRRADIRRFENDREGASLDAEQALQSSKATAVQVRRALAMIEPTKLAGVADLPAVTLLAPEDKVRVASDFNRSRLTADTTRNILRPLIDKTGLSPDVQNRVRHELILASIALGRCSEALRISREEESDIHKMNIEFAFNYGMALWGDKGHVVQDPFGRVVELNRLHPKEDPSPHFFQCMSVAYWAIGEPERACEALENARRKITRRPREFSCWRYSDILRREFDEDIEEIFLQINGDDTMRPRFMRETKGIVS